MKIEEPKIKIMPYVWYNQMQAYNFWLNHTQWIIMNYFSYWLPNYGHPLIMNWNTYWWMSIHKPSIDMPTLQISEWTYRENIRHLIEEKLIDRIITKVDWVSRAYYRVTEKWLTHSTYTHPSDFNTLYNTLENLLKWEEISDWNKNKLLTLISSYTEKKEKKITEIILDDEWVNEFTRSILNELRRGEAIFSVWKTIDNSWVQENIVDQIKKVWQKSSWYKLWPDWKADADTRRIILRHLSKMIDWYIDKRKTISNMKSTINNWFWKDKI